MQTEIAAHEIDLRIEDDCLTVVWPDRGASRFHYVWLRDNCRHPSRWTELTGERTQMTEDIPLDLTAKDARIDSDGCVVIEWSDGTPASRFDPDWLWDYRYDGPPMQPLLPSSTPWRADYGSNPLTFEAEAILEDEDALCGMLDAYVEYGLIRVTGVPPVDQEVERFANRLAYVREIIFDRVADIRPSPDPYNIGFTNVSLPLHTDCSGYAWPPNVMAFHCLRNDVIGGEALYADGEQAVRDLRAQDPEALRVLCDVPIRHRLYSKSADTQRIAPRVTLHPNGELAILRYANWTPQPLHPPRPEDVPAFYRAHKKLASIVNDPRNVAVIRPEPGDLLLVNNQRVLHGRRAFDLGDGDRHFQQVYMELDDLVSLRRTIARKHEKRYTHQ